MPNRTLLSVIVIAALMLVQLSGCTLLPSAADRQPLEEIDTLLADNHYQRAENRIVALQSDSTQRLEKLQQRLERALAKGREQASDLVEKRDAEQALQAGLAERAENVAAGSAQFVEQQFLELDQLRKQGLWRDADQLLQATETQALPSKRLEDYRLQFDRERQLALVNLEHRLVMLESRQLPEREAIYRALANTGFGDASLYARLSLEQDQKNRVLSSLRERAAKAEREADPSAALQYLRALDRLDSRQSVGDKIAELETQLARRSERDPKAKPAAAAGRVAKVVKPSRLEADYEAALAAERWLEARQLLDQQLAVQADSPALKAQDAYLEDKFRQIVDTAKVEAESSYTLGDIEAALSIWQGALPYAPEDLSLMSNIQRAEKILNKLETLQAESQTVSP